MIVIVDTSPLNYLILIDLARILTELFGQVVIPQAVLSELQSPQAPDQVCHWFARRPAWLVVRKVQQEDATLAHLDLGEREAITLDENQGRREAINRGFNVTGTVGLLDRAGTQGLIDVPTAVARLRQTSFRVSPRLLNALLDRYKS